MQSAKDILLNNGLRIVSEIGMVPPPLPHLVYCGYFSWFFGRCCSSVSSFATLAWNFCFVYIVQLGVRKKYLQSYSIPLFPMYFYSNDLTLISQQLSEGQLPCVVCKGGFIGSKWLVWGHLTRKSGIQKSNARLPCTSSMLCPLWHAGKEILFLLPHRNNLFLRRNRKKANQGE